ncbi:MAG: hypothetical protein IT519_08975 [Burkholderiales bacterium]|jgi:hypothetical protein|nr:hypothetical protein [Burkholderiales bacterium]
MVSCTAVRINAASSVHLVIAAWLFVTGTMALTFETALRGIAFFSLAGVAPVAFHAWARIRALRRARRSVVEQHADERDDRDAGADQG